jgi:hypothetical protein
MGFDPYHNVIHTAGGQLSPKAPTSAADVRRIVGEAIASQSASGIVVNFHGGLVSASDALETARDRLYPLYSGADAYPIFFVWESGFLEAPFNNLQEIGKEALFQEFVKKVAEWVVKKLGGGSVLTAAALAKSGESPKQVRADISGWFASAGPRSKLPDKLKQFRAARRVPVTAFRAALPQIDEAALAAEIEADLRTDRKMQAALTAAQAGVHPQRRALRSAAGGSRVSATSQISKEAAARLFAPQPARRAQLPLGGWLQAAKVIASIVLRVLSRIHDGRDHGKYVTFAEEVLRELYVDKIGRTVWWDRMKGDTADAFNTGDEFGGTVFLRALHDQLPASGAPRITLIGHSTGAIYIGNFLKAAAQWAPDQHFDVIFEAPAATHDFLAAVLEEHASRIDRIRAFAMSDARERDDVLVPVVYPASLLYFVAGLLEGEPDQPLIGMQRFLDDSVYGAADFPNVDRCRKYFATDPKSLVWSPQLGPAAPQGSQSDGKHHQDFDDVDPLTIASVAFIIKNGY